MIGKVLGGRYKVLEKLGSGGMAVVYKARCTWLDRLVTIKVLREELVSDEEFVRRFRREAQAVAKLSHPNIVSVYDVGQEDGVPYIVMEYVEGQTLKDLIRREGKLKTEQALEIAVQICTALEHAHENGIIHRDIKPQNILVTSRGKVKVTDFGIARAASGATVTHTGKIIGTVHYLSPEQARGEIVGTASDLYSTGAVLYEMLTGRVPFEGESPISIALKHLQEPIVPLRQLVPTIPPAVEQVVLRAMNKDPRLRFSSAKEMASALQAAARGKKLPLPFAVSEAVGGEPASKWEEDTRSFEVVRNEAPPAQQKKRKIRPYIWAIILLAFLGFLGGGFYAVNRWIVVPEVAVPMVQGKVLEEAMADLERSGLKGVVVAQQYSNEVGKNRIISQEPEAESVVKKGRTVKLTVSLGPQLALVPNVKGKTLTEASILITNAGFKVGSIEPVYSDQVPADQVVSQIPAADTQQPVGTAVELIVSKGAAPQSIEMPSLLGLRLEAAEFEIKRLGLVLGTVGERESGEFFVGQVIEQDIPAHTQVWPGATVNLVVSKGPGPAPRNATVTVRVPAGDGEHQVVIVVEDRKDRREVYRGNHSANDLVRESVRYYGQGKIQVFIDGKLIEERNVD